MIPRKPLVGKRFAVGTYTDGVWTQGSSSTLNFTASVQPLSGKDKESLPEGFREKAGYKLYTDTEMKTVDEKNGISADQVTIDGLLYEVVTVGVWQNSIINHYKVIVSLIE